uniref:60S ribosomal protein L13 n=1 Tax=Percolomonas cosmopolitus TaxID=63605 RepID=A0A7S1KLW3_9EUKA|eukprot:CAMPEP_0117450286 /NCGR_PEP_ID=MMETSP0759-20121206/8387_1 /TAXON_ID=63605 /ORGANISM="Percolomonas cosmopolitus, Strain WS" /LENGTH=203 /DNA_ID=CAMNT_0005242797 /DNA_START=61 /DNA_END=672 /DNA_ORIENTATION=+
MVKHNNAIPRDQIKKKWQERTKTFFSVPAKAQKRKALRKAKAAAIYPRPLELLRPVVQCETVRYNMKARLGRGFSLQELKAAGIPPAFAKTIGIAVDKRRKNKSQESLDRNVARLNAYKEKLILFPRKAGQPKKGPIADTTNIDDASVQQVSGNVLPLPRTSGSAVVDRRAISKSELDGETPMWDKTRAAIEDAKPKKNTETA